MNYSDWGDVAPNNAADQVLESVSQEAEAVQYQDQVVSEALKRIEQAKLYETLLRHSLFAPGSARPEILNLVESQIRGFVTEQLEILVGLRTKEGVKHQETVSQFSEEQVGALKALADRVIKKDQTAQRIAEPQLVAVGSASTTTPTPTLNVVGGNQLKQPAQQPQQPKKRGPQKQKPGAGYKPMPTQNEINQKLAMESGRLLSGNSAVETLLKTAAVTFQEQNKHIEEE